MKLYHVFVLVFCLCGFSVQAQKYYGVKKQTLPFDKIAAYGFYDVVIDGAKPKPALYIRDPQLEVSPEVLVHNVFEPVVTHGELQVVGIKSVDGRPTPFLIHHQRLKQITCDGEGNVLAQNLNLEVFRVVASGKCRLSLTGQIQHLRVELSGESVVDLSQAKILGLSQSVTGESRLVQKK